MGTNRQRVGRRAEEEGKTTEGKKINLYNLSHCADIPSKYYTICFIIPYATFRDAAATIKCI